MANTDFEEWIAKVGQWQQATNKIPALVHEDIMKSKISFDEPEAGIKSLMVDPLAVQYALGYKDRKHSLTYDVLKRIPHQLGIVAAILQTRCNQVAAFSVPFRSSKSVGFQIKHKDPGHETSKSEKEFIQDLERFIYNCGAPDPNPYNKLKRDDFETFLKKITRDSLTYDQCCVEIVPDRLGQPYEFMAVDASTIRLSAHDSVFGPNDSYIYRPPVMSNRLLTQPDERTPFKSMQLMTQTRNGERPDFVQVINGQIENVYYRDEMSFGIRNPRTDIYIQGYGYGEMEQLITILTAHLYAEEYNRRFFMQGCVAGDTPVHTEEGIVPIQSLVGQGFRAWNGHEFVPADVVSSGFKKCVNTTLSNDFALTTSPDHQFLSMSDTGESVMLPISELGKGAYVAVSCKEEPVHTSESEDGTVPVALQQAIALEALQAVPFLEFTKTVGVPVSVIKRCIAGKGKLGREVLKKLLPFVDDKELHRSLEYRWETIVSTDPSDLEIPMYDVRQTHELHQWSCGGCITKNSAPKGILNFKGENFTPDMLEGFKRQWRANLEGVENCIAGTTRVYTKEHGYAAVEDICGDKPEVPANIWTGTSWETGLVYKTKKPKILCHTRLDNGITVSTSPDHKIRVIGESGDPEFRRQEDLTVGDVVLTNKQDTSAGTELYCLGKKVTPEFMEALGWFLGDGNVSRNTLSWFYHHDKEQDLLDKHLAVIQQYFPRAKKHVRFRTLEQIENVKKSYGFKSVADRITNISLSMAAARAWLEAHNFCTGNVKTVPPQIFTMPYECRCAYLRGIFSADGNCAKLRHPAVTIADNTIREDIKQLLNSVGIRTSLSEGKTHISDVKTRARVEDSSVLRVKDRDAFFADIGFLQAHKQPKGLKRTSESNKQDRVPPSTIQKYMLDVRKANKASGYTLLTRSERMDLNSVLCGSDGCSRGRLITYMLKCSLVPPSWLYQYNTASVVSSENTGLLIPMFDVSIDHSDHEFMGNNVVISNSWKTPILQAEQGVEWIDLHPSNREMEYGQWLEYLIKITSAVFLIDPSELNFDLSGGVQQTPLFESSNEWKLKASRDKGLKPLLRFIAKQINDNIIAQIDDHFVFDFVGLDELSEQEKHELRQEQVGSYMTLNEIRRAEDLPDVEDGDTILNPTYIQARQARVQQEQEQAQQDQAAGAGAEGLSAPEEPASAADQGQQENTAPDYAGTFRKSQEGVIEIDLDLYKDLYRGK